jgi:hypothetical protein
MYIYEILENIGLTPPLSKREKKICVLYCEKREIPNKKCLLFIWPNIYVRTCKNVGFANGQVITVR